MNSLQQALATLYGIGVESDKLKAENERLRESIRRQSFSLKALATNANDKAAQLDAELSETES